MFMWVCVCKLLKWTSQWAKVVARTLLWLAFCHLPAFHRQLLTSFFFGWQDACLVVAMCIYLLYLYIVGFLSICLNIIFYNICINVVHMYIENKKKVFHVFFFITTKPHWLVIKCCCNYWSLKIIFFLFSCLGRLCLVFHKTSDDIHWFSFVKMWNPPRYVCAYFNCIFFLYS